MVQAIENWAALEGTVRDMRTSDVRADLDEVDVAVDRVEPVDPYPNLLSETLGSTVSVTIPKDVVKRLSIEPGVRIRCQARRTSPLDVFARPDSVTVVGRT